MRRKTALATSNTLENAAGGSLNVFGPNNPIESDTIKAWGFVRERKVLLGASVTVVAGFEVFCIQDTAQCHS